MRTERPSVPHADLPRLLVFSVTHCAVVSPLTSLTIPSASFLNLLHCSNFSPRGFAAFTLYSLYLVICVSNSVVSTVICMLMTSNP